MKISKESLVQIIKEEMSSMTGGTETDPLEKYMSDKVKSEIIQRLRGTSSLDYFKNKVEINKALDWYFQSTTKSTPGVKEAFNFVLGWLGGSGKK